MPSSHKTAGQKLCWSCRSARGIARERGQPSCTGCQKRGQTRFGLKLSRPTENRITTHGRRYPFLPMRARIGAVNTGNNDITGLDHRRPTQRRLELSFRGRGIGRARAARLSLQIPRGLPITNNAFQSSPGRNESTPDITTTAYDNILQDDDISMLLLKLSLGDGTLPFTTTQEVIAALPYHHLKQEASTSQPSQQTGPPEANQIVSCTPRSGNADVDRAIQLLIKLALQQGDMVIDKDAPLETHESQEEAERFVVSDGSTPVIDGDRMLANSCTPYLLQSGSARVEVLEGHWYALG